MDIAAGRILIHGILACGLFGSVVMLSLWWNPRLWVQDAPKEMQAVVSPLTEDEKRTQKILFVVVLVSMFGIPIWSLWQLRLEYGGQVPYLSAFAHAWLLMQLMNLFDAVVLDWFILVEHMPEFAIIPGTEDVLYTMRNPRWHLKNYVKGVVIVTLLSLLLALVAAL